MWNSNAQLPARSLKFGSREELAGVEQKVDALLRKTGINPKEIDMVFLTGGSSFVPAVRRIFESAFRRGKDSHWRRIYFRGPGLSPASIAVA